MGSLWRKSLMFLFDRKPFEKSNSVTDGLDEEVDSPNITVFSQIEENNVWGGDYSQNFLSTQQQQKDL